MPRISVGRKDGTGALVRPQAVAGFYPPNFLPVEVSEAPLHGSAIQMDRFVPLLCNYGCCRERSDQTPLDDAVDRDLARQSAAAAAGRRAILHPTPWSSAWCGVDEARRERGMRGKGIAALLLMAGLVGCGIAHAGTS